MIKKIWFTVVGLLLATTCFAYGALWDNYITREIGCHICWRPGKYITLQDKTGVDSLTIKDTGTYAIFDADNPIQLLTAAEDIILTAGTDVITVSSGSGVATFDFGSLDLSTDAFTVTSLTASKPVFTDGSKNLVSTGTLGVDQGGTGVTTLTTYGVLLGAGSSPISKTAAGTDGKMLLGQTSAEPTWNAMSGEATLSASGVLALAALDADWAAGDKDITGLEALEADTVTATTHLLASGTFALGDDGETGAINTSDWDISVTGDFVGAEKITFTEDAGRTGEGTCLFANGVPIGMTTPGDCQGMKMEFDYGVSPTLGGGGKMVQGLMLKLDMTATKWIFGSANYKATVRGASIQAVCGDSVGGMVQGIYANAKADSGTSYEYAIIGGTTQKIGLLAIEARTEIGRNAIVTAPSAVGLLCYHHQHPTGAEFTGEYRAIQLDQPLVGTQSGDMYGIYFADDHSTGYGYDYAIGFDTALDGNIIGAAMTNDDPNTTDEDGYILIDVGGTPAKICFWYDN